MTLFARVIELLRERGAADIVVFGGGIIPDADITELSRMGVAKIFTPGASTTDIVAWVRAELGHQVTEGRSSPARRGQPGRLIVPGSAAARTSPASGWPAARVPRRGRFSPTGRPRLSSALRIRYWTVFLCSISRSAVVL